LLADHELVLAVDTETTGLELRHGCKPFAVSAADAFGETWFVEWEVNPLTRQPCIKQKDIRKLKELLEGRILVFHNASFDLLALSTIGINLSFDSPTLSTGKSPINCPTYHDTTLMSHAANSQGIGEQPRHGLKELCTFYLEIPDHDEKLLKQEVEKASRYVQSQARREDSPYADWKLGYNPVGGRKTAYDYWLPKAVDPNNTALSEYATKDAERTIQLYLFLEALLSIEELTNQYLAEQALSKVTYLMQQKGLHILTDKLASLTSSFQRKRDQLKLKAEKLAIKRGAPEDFNVASPIQLIKTLKENFHCHLAHKTEKGSFSTDDATLRNLARKNPGETEDFLRAIIGYNSDKDLQSDRDEPGYKTYESGIRYLKGYQSYLIGDTLYPSFNQCGTSTTRYSSSNPNGQNISKKGSIPLRSIFGPPEGFVWVSIDYSQLELRLFAYLSQDESLIHSFEEGYDFHGYVTQKIFNCEDYTPEQRTVGKNTNFSLIYGGGEDKVNATAGIPNAYKLFVTQFPGAESFMSRLIRETRAKGYITTPDGYRLYVPKEYAYRSLNYLIQGTAGRIIKLAMTAIDQKELVDWKDSFLIANIHDELLFEYNRDLPYKKIARRTAREMEKAGENLGIPCPTDIKWITTNWLD